MKAQTKAMMTRDPYLQVTFRRGKAVAAYYHLPHRVGLKSVRTETLASGLLVDYARGGRPLGIEITSPAELTLAALNRALRGLGQPTVRRAELAPLFAA